MRSSIRHALLLATAGDDKARSRLTPELLEKWKEFGERFGGSSWSGARECAGKARRRGLN